MKTYIDCGAHNGDSVVEFIESRSIFVPRRDAGDYRILAFEPNADAYATADRLRSYRNVTVSRKAAWTHDGEVEFKNAPESLSSCVSKYQMQGFDEGRSSRRMFPCIDLARLVGDIESSHLVLKMDVESAEYDILPAILRAGAMRKVDELYVEYHNPWIAGNARIRAEIEAAISAMDVKYFNYWP